MQLRASYYLPDGNAETFIDDILGTLDGLDQRKVQSAANKLLNKPQQRISLHRHEVLRLVMVRGDYFFDTSVELSRLSREVTLEGVTAKVRIYRLQNCAEWMLAVIVDEVFTFFDASFDSDTAALGAFQFTVQDEGIGTFLDRGDTETLH